MSFRCLHRRADSGSAGIEANGAAEVIVLKSFWKKYRKIFTETVSADIFLFLLRYIR